MNLFNKTCRGLKSKYILHEILVWRAQNPPAMQLSQFRQSWHIGQAAKQLESMTFNLGFHEKFIWNPWGLFERVCNFILKKFSTLWWKTGASDNWFSCLHWKSNDFFTEDISIFYESRNMIQKLKMNKSKSTKMWNLSSNINMALLIIWI